jgi:dynein heavy chain
VYDYNFDLKTKAWVSWLNTVPEYVVNTAKSFETILVPTLDSIRCKALTKLLITNSKHIICPGPTGTGKSVNVAQLLTYELEDNYMTLTMVFSAQTSANQTQDQLDSRFDKRRKGVFGPPVGKKFVLFIDDINMPKKEEWGAIPPLELVRQFMDHKGWYDRKSKEKPFLTIEDLIIVAAGGPPGGGRQDVPERLLRHYNMLTYTDLQNESISQIFTTILAAFFSSFQAEVKDSVPKLMEMSLELYEKVLNGPLKPIPKKAFYLFNLRDVSRIAQGVVKANRREVIEAV